MPLRVYDPVQGVRRDFVPLEPGKVGMYVCGMTVQDEPHLGHMFAFLAGDVMRRFLEVSGFEVRYVLNFTDVDDKIIARAAREGVPYEQISERNIAAFYRYADLLNIRRATVHPRATEHIPEIQEMISGLIGKNCAYASGGDVYFDVARYPGYGRISGRKIDDLRSGARIEPGENKRSPLDFALWKSAKPGEPYWESPWGHGRPGWHIECSAMSRKWLGERFDLHGGGIDLIFPHHENEAAQSEAASGKDPVNFWVRNGMLRLAGEKMSKSTGHFLRVADVSERVDPRALRLYLISSHFRSPLEYSEDRIEEARQGLARFETFFRNVSLATGDGAGVRAGDAGGGGDAGAASPGSFGDTMEAARRGFRDAMEDDFNSARALGYLFEAVRNAHRYLEAGGASGPERATGLGQAVAVVREGLGILGIKAEPEERSAVPKEILDQVQAREAARRARDWALADQIRESVKNKGFTIEDREGGPIVIRTT